MSTETQEKGSLPDGAVKVISKSDIKPRCRLFYELGEKFLTEEQREWNNWVNGRNPVEIKFRKGKPTKTSLLKHLKVGWLIKRPTGVKEIEPVWVRSGSFKEIHDVKRFLKNDSRLNDKEYIDHHNFHVL